MDAFENCDARHIDSIKCLLLDMAHERTVDSLLDLIVTRLNALADVALTRVWLVAPGDICESCHLRAECPDQQACLHLVASAGSPTRPCQQLESDVRSVSTFSDGRQKGRAHCRNARTSRSARHPAKDQNGSPIRTGLHGKEYEASSASRCCRAIACLVCWEFSFVCLRCLMHSHGSEWLLTTPRHRSPMPGPLKK